MRPHIIGFIIEYYTSHSCKSMLEVAESCRTCAAPSIICGGSLGMQVTLHTPKPQPPALNLAPKPQTPL